ncbi:MAG: acetyl-CoA decarbonylase/synthase complex subunit gamma [bacterium]|nr:acetyl-CoA decarbonylase/synthase complex subunit gamma [bacterium]
MALSGIEIFKYLPKTNCGKCKFPTCLAFAMKLAVKQASLDQCPDVSPESKAKLSDASAPPIRLITIGTGENAVSVGEETIMFRHEKTFYHTPGIAVVISDKSSADEIKQKVDKTVKAAVERVGQHLKVDLIAIENESGDPQKFAEAVKLITGLTSLPLILKSDKIDSLKSALPFLNGKKPLIWAANETNYHDFAQAAKENGCSLAVYEPDLNKLSDLVEKITALGVKDLVLDPGALKAKDIIEKFTIIRRSAIKKAFKPFGYPVMSFFHKSGDSMMEVMLASVAISKYGSIIGLSSAEMWKVLPLFALRQNIYTDPQKPMKVEQKIYKIGDPDKNSPLMITTNFSLTYFLVAGEIENSKVSAWLAVQDSEGLSVMTAWAAGKFSAGSIANFINTIKAAELVNHKKLIIPGYVSVLSGSLQEKLPDWNIIVGPREANAIPVFFKNEWK